MTSQLIRKLKLVLSRATVNRVATSFIIASFFFCISQGISQSFLLSVNSEFHSITSAIVQKAEIPDSTITWLQGSKGKLHLYVCSDIPFGKQRDSCTEVFSSPSNTSQNPAGVTTVELALQSKKDVEITTVFSDAGLPDGVEINAKGQPVARLSEQCSQVFLLPSQMLRNYERENLTFIFLHIWLVGISFYAIIRNSVPHILAVFFTRSIITAWSIYLTWRTGRDQSIFRELLVDPGSPCSLQILQTYFTKLIAFGMTDMILNMIALLLMSALSLKLLKDYSTRSFTCIGAPKHINRIIKYFMAVMVCLQMEVFVLVAAMGLWVDVVVNTAIKNISLHTNIYQALVISTTILLLPWIALGWHAIRNEIKKMMLGFLVIGFILTAGWLLMFYSQVYRWTFVQWPFMACFVTASLILIISSMVLGVICRLQFGKGHAEYLRAEEALSSSNFTLELFNNQDQSSDWDMKTPVKVKEFEF